MAEKKARGIKLAAASVAMVVVGSGAALAATVTGTNAGEVLRGTDRADTIHAYGGADLIYGKGGGDTVWGGNDTLEGQYGDDLIVGGTGEDTLYGGPGADEVDAQDGRRDVIDLTGAGADDVVYYDKGVDEFVRASVGPVEEGASVVEAAGAELTAAEPPEGLFEPHARVLVEHKGERLLVAEERVGAHMAHGDEIIDPTGRAGEEGGRR